MRPRAGSGWPDHGSASPRRFTLGDVERELALELGPPARVAPATSMSRSIRPTPSRSTSAVAASPSWPGITAVACLRPEMEGDGDHYDAHHNYRCAQEYRPTRGPHRVKHCRYKPRACE